VRRILLSLAFLLAATAFAQLPAVTTRSFDNSRSGDNTQETVLTSAAVLAKGMVRQTTIPVIGDARGMEAQPLVLPGVKLKDGSTHDVMVLPSMANVVRGVDAETGAGLWQVTLGTPIQGSAAIDFHVINDKWGVLSTGVIDPATQRVYLVAWVSPDGTAQKAVHFIYQLSVVDGSQVVPPISLAGQTSRAQSYSSAMRKQRSALLLVNEYGHKTVFFAIGTVLETGPGAAGWIFALDCPTHTLTSLALSDGLGAGIWMGAQGLAADATGYLYGVTGNGSFNGATDFAESVFKVQYNPPTTTAKAALTVVSWWTPYSDAGRTGLNPQLSGPPVEQATKLAGMSAPTEAVMPVGAGMNVSLAKAKVVVNTNSLGQPVQLVYPVLPTQTAWDDEDLGSGGGTLLAQYQLYLASGKDGIGYVVKTGAMGNTNPADFANAATNCAKLASSPVWLTEDPGPVNPCPQDETTLNFMPWGKTRHLHMTPVQYMSPTRGMTLFVWGENSQLHAWTISGSGTLTYLAQGNEVASANVVNSPGGMPGGFCSLSSNNNALGSAVLWCSIPYGDANATITNGRLLAYDPENLIVNPDGTKTLRVLWDSQQWALAYVYNKFMPPIAWNGRVYLPNYSGGVDVYGLAN
jgi:hypothetical protein